MYKSVTQAAPPPQGMVRLIRADTPRLIRRFVEVPFKLYRGHSWWVPPLRRDERRRFDPRHNPFLEHATITCWIAERDGQPVGRVAAVEDRLHDETHGEKTTWFGFFEAADAAVAQLLLQQVERRGREQGRSIVRGPVNPSLNETAGLLIEGFEAHPYILMPYNPPEHQGFIEACGYRKAKDLLAWDIDLTSPVSERIQRVAERVRQRADIRVRTVDMADFEGEIATLQEVYRRAWEDNWGFVAPTDREIRQLARDLRPVIEPELVLFAEKDGQPVGCVVSLPDLNQVLLRMGGRLWPFGLLHFLRRRRVISRARMLLLGVVPEARRLGIYPLLIAESQQRGIALGLTRGELSWTLEDNELVNAGIEAAGGRRYKTYRLYEKSLD